MALTLPLAKFQMSYRWDENQHPRDDSGRFTGAGGHGGAPSFRQRGLREPSPGPGAERRSLTRGETWQRVGAKLPELPVEYTGSRQRELPADWFTAPPKIDWQIPKDMPVDAHLTTLGHLRRIVKDNRSGAIEKAKVTRQKVAVHGIKDRYTLKRRTGDLILSPDAPRGTVNRAYNHAAMMALHDFGVVDYNFPKMSQPMKDELTPLVPFMRFVHRRLSQEMRKDPATAGKYAPYVQAFGKPFADNRTDKRTGAVRLRLRPNKEFVKDADGAGLPLAKRSIEEMRLAARAVSKPTPAQAEAGNYRKGHVSIDGVRVAIENPKGSIRRKVGRNGKPWSVRMPAHYGYVKRTTGADGDHVDVYLGPKAHEASQHLVHIIDQVNTHTGAFDEHKAMVGFPTREAAITAYDAGFSDGKGPSRRGAVTSLSWRTFKRWLRTGDTTSPIALTKRAPMRPGCANEHVDDVMGDVEAILGGKGKGPGPGGDMDPDVAGIMPHVHRLLGPMQPRAMPTPGGRLKANSRVADHRMPLAHVTA